MTSERQKAKSESWHRREAFTQQRKAALEQEFGMTGHPKADIVFQLALKYGFRGNLRSVYIDLVQVALSDSELERVPGFPRPPLVLSGIMIPVTPDEDAVSP